MTFWQQLKDRNVVRVAAVYLAGSWLILQVADLIFEAYAFPDGSMRFLIAILAIGFPGALALSWIYQWTPQGLIRDSGEPMDQPRQRSSGRKATLTVVVLAALAIAVLLVGRSIETTEPDAVAIDSAAPPGSIAVIPFDNVSADEATDYFADGLSTELLNLLADVPELRVTGRTSSFYYKDRNLDPRTIGTELNVANILEGEVRKAGDQLRITVALIDTQTGYQVWGDTYDRELADIFDLQNEIAARTVDGLRVTILGEPPQVRQADPEAFDLFLNAGYFYGQRTPDDYRRAVEYLERSIEIDPGFTPAWTLLSSAYVNMTIIGIVPFDEGREQARDAVEQALEIDQDFVFANSARAWQAMYFESDYELAGAFFNRALQLAPGNPTILSNAAVYSSVIGNPEDAVDLTREAIARDPVSPVSWLNLSSQYNRAGRYNDAIAAARKALELRSGMLGAIVNLCEAYLLAEQPERALSCADDIPDAFHQTKTRAFAFTSLGRSPEAQPLITELVDENAAESAFEIARLQAWSGDTDSAFDWLDRAIDERQDILGLASDPMLRSLHADARWDPLLRELRLADDQVSPIRL